MICPGKAAHSTAKALASRIPISSVDNCLLYQHQHQLELTEWCWGCCVPLMCRYAKGDAADQCAVYSTDKDADGKEIGAQAESYWLRVVPWAFYKLLKYVDDR